MFINQINVRKSEIELLKFLATGKTIKECAVYLNKKYYNIQKRTQLLYKKFGVNDRKELIKKNKVCKNIIFIK